MILLLTRENSSYDSVAKTFWFNLDKQLDSSVKVIRIQTFSYQPPTLTRRNKTTATAFTLFGTRLH